MAKQSFLLVSLQEDKAKKLAQVVSNESCRKILDYLADKESTETELATNLQLPISTVHYNLKQLVGAGLVSSEEFHYSAKGKEVSHYKLANKYIIIAPKSTFGIKEKLKSILPVVLIVSAAAGLLQLFNSGTMRSLSAANAENFVNQKSAAMQAAPMMQPAASDQVQSALQQTVHSVPNIALWFLAGALFAIIVFLIVSRIRKEKL